MSVRRCPPTACQGSRLPVCPQKSCVRQVRHGLLHASHSLRDLHPHVTVVERKHPEGYLISRICFWEGNHYPNFKLFIAVYTLVTNPVRKIVDNLCLDFSHWAVENFFFTEATVKVYPSRAYKLYATPIMICQLGICLMLGQDLPMSRYFRSKLQVIAPRRLRSTRFAV